MKELVILGSSLSALAIARNAHAEGLDPIIFDKKRDIACHTALARIDLHENETDEELLRALCRLGDNGRNYLIATSDDWLKFIVNSRAVLDQAYLKVLHSGNDVLNICLNKEMFAAWCLNHRFETPKILLSKEKTSGNPDMFDGFDSPILIRPTSKTDISGIPKAIEVSSLESLIYWSRYFQSKAIDWIASESLLGQRLVQYSVAIAKNENDMVSFVAKKMRPLPRECAVGTYVVLSPNEAVENLGRGIANQIDFFGIGEVEILHSLDSGKNYVIEFNARPWIQYELAVKSGHDFLRFLMFPEKYDRTYEMKQGKYWLDFGEDLYYCFSQTVGYVRKKEIGLGAYINSIVRANVYPIFYWKDLRVFIYALKQLMRMVLKSRKRI